MIHAAAAGADEVLALGQDLHQLLEGRLDAVGAQQREGEGYQQGGGGRQAGSRRKIAGHGRVDAVKHLPLAFDRLRRGLDVVLPIAGRRWLELGGPIEGAVAVGLGGGTDAPVAALAVGHRDAALDGYREDREVVIVDMLADQVHASGHRDDGDGPARSETLVEQLNGVLGHYWGYRHDTATSD